MAKTSLDVLTIRPTKMLAQRLGLELPPTAPAVANRVADWCAHEFRFGRFRYLMFCNTASLYPVVTYARGVNDDHALIERLMDTLRQNLTGIELEYQFQQRIVPERGNIQWAPIPDRSILGSINDMITMTKCWLEDGEGVTSDLSRWLAESPMSTLGMDSPDRVFPRLGR